MCYKASLALETRIKTRTLNPQNPSAPKPLNSSYIGIYKLYLFIYLSIADMYIDTPQTTTPDLIRPSWPQLGHGSDVALHAVTSLARGLGVQGVFGILTLGLLIIMALHRSFV